MIRLRVGGIETTQIATLGRTTVVSVLEQGAKIAPVFTTLIALIAATVAILSLRAQREIARKRAAIDFGMKVVTDQTIMGALYNYHDAIEMFHQLPSISEFYSTTEHKTVLETLQIMELLSIGVLTKVFDEEVCHAIFSTAVLSVHNAGIPYLSQRKEIDGEPTWQAFPKLAKRWGRGGSRPVDQFRL